MKGGPWLLLFHAATGGARPFPAAAGGPRAPAMRVQPRVRRGMTAMDIDFNKAVEAFTAISPLFMVAAVVVSPYIVVSAATALNMMSINKLEVKSDKMTTDVIRLEGTVNQTNAAVDKLAGKVEKLDGKMDKMTTDVVRLEGTVNQINTSVDALKVGFKALEEAQQMRDDKRDELHRTFIVEQRMRDDKRDELQRMRDDKRDELQRMRDDKRDEILFQVLAQSQRAPQP